MQNLRHEQRARSDLPADLRIPCIAADEFARIEPHFDAAAAQRIANALCRFRVLRGTAEKNGATSGCWLVIRHESVGRQQVPCQLRADEIKAEGPWASQQARTAVSLIKDIETIRWNSCPICHFNWQIRSLDLLLRGEIWQRGIDPIPRLNPRPDRPHHGNKPFPS